MNKPNKQIMMQEYLRPEPTPKGVTSRDIVRKAIEFDDPPRIPYNFVLHPNKTDLYTIIPFAPKTSSRLADQIGSTYVDHWGVTWEVTGRGWDHAIKHPLTDLGKLDEYRFPDIHIQTGPVTSLGETAYQVGKYVVGGNIIMMYETMRSLVGFEELMMAPYLQPDGLLELLEQLTTMTVGLIEAYARLGIIDGFLTWEDWGLQTSLQVKIDTFREFYKPFYKRVINACHQNGMHFIWHTCGNVLELFPDMIELGVDVVQMDQPRLMGHRELINVLGGKLCMWNSVDIQWSTEEELTIEELRQEVINMLRVYDVGGYGGGYIAKHYTQPWDIDLSVERQQAISNAFMENGCQL